MFNIAVLFTKLSALRLLKSVRWVEEEPENRDKRETYQEDFNQVAIAKASSRQHKVVILWWKAWLSQSFRNLVPRSKWIQVNRNVAKAIICHIIYMNRVSSLLFHLYRVIKIPHDENKLERTCTVKFYSCDLRNEGDIEYLLWIIHI